MKTMLVPVGWLLSLVAAFFVGQVLAADGAAEPPTAAVPEEVALLEDKVESLEEQLEAERTRHQRSRERGARKGGTPYEGGNAPVEVASGDTPPQAADGEPVSDTFSLEGISDAADGSERFMAFVDAQLGRGEKGQEAILRALNALWENRQALEALFGDESIATRELYPWVKFLVNREREMVDLSEYVFRTMAEEPQKLSYVADDNVFEIFTEGVGILLPGAVSEERLTTFRGYATKILETPKDQQPESVSGNRGEIERLVQRFWTAPISADEALARLEAGDVPPDELARLLRRVPMDKLANLDVTGLILPLISAGNNDVMRLVRVIPAEKLDMPRIEQALLEGMQSGKVREWYAARIIGSGGRSSWADVRPFAEVLFTRGDKLANAGAQMLTYLPQNLRPDPDYVANLIERGVLNEGMAKRLGEVFKKQ